MPEVFYQRIRRRYQLSSLEPTIRSFKRPKVIKTDPICLHHWIAVLGNGLTNIKWITYNKMVNRMCTSKVKTKRPVKVSSANLSRPDTAERYCHLQHRHNNAYWNW